MCIFIESVTKSLRKSVNPAQKIVVFWKLLAEAATGLQLYLKRDSATGVFLWILRYV